MQPAADYTEYPPCDALATYVACFWTRTSPGGAAPDTHRVLPDGCLDILCRLAPGGSGPGEEDLRAIGTMTRPLEVTFTEPVEVVAARFRPGGAFAFLGVPLRELTDDTVALGELWPSTGALLEALGGPRTLRQKVQALEQHLVRKLRSVERPVDPVIQVVIDEIIRRPACRSVRELSEFAGLSRQHLTRRFNQLVGLGPKQLARILRLQSVLEQVGPSWAGTAIQAGYFDQAHMIAEFQALTGRTPGQWLRSPQACAGP